MSELVSIITPCFNSEKFLDECISSVINQTYQNWEMLIVDDNSSDNSSILIKSYSKHDDRIKPILLKDNVGPAMARNTAISISKGKYLAFLDSDDIWLPEKLKLQINFMKKNNYSFVFSSYSVITPNETKPKYEVSVPEKISYKQYLKNTIIGCLTVVLDKERFKNIQMPIYRSSHDMALWLDLLKEEEFAFELRTRDRERKLINKIAISIEQIKQDEYGWCESCGDEIGIKRLEARPTATHCIHCKTLDEIKEKQLSG